MSILQKKCAENEKSIAERFFLIFSAMFWYASHLGSTKTDWVLFFLKNLLLKKLKTVKNALKVLTKLTYEYLQYIHTPNFWGFPCSQGHNLLVCDQPDLKILEKNTTFWPKYGQRQNWKKSLWSTKKLETNVRYLDLGKKLES